MAKGRFGVDFGPIWGSIWAPLGTPFLYPKGFILLFILTSVIKQKKTIEFLQRNTTFLVPGELLGCPFGPKRGPKTFKNRGRK